MGGFMVWNGLGRYADIGLLIFRLGFGLGFIYFHGGVKLFETTEQWIETGSALRHFGINFGHYYFGMAAAVGETVGGLLVALGLFFRPAAALLTWIMIVAFTDNSLTGGNISHPFKNIFLFAGFIFIGPGRYSMDYVLSRKREGARLDTRMAAARN
jgi:putative oxidoreductase